MATITRKLGEMTYSVLGMPDEECLKPTSTVIEEINFYWQYVIVF